MFDRFEENIDIAVVLVGEGTRNVGSVPDSPVLWFVDGHNEIACSLFAPLWLVVHL